MLASGGDARSAAGDGRLIPSAGAPPTDRSDTFRVAPRDPFPTCGDGLGLPFQGPDGIQDQRTVDGRPDVLVYTSSALDSVVTIVGSQELVLYLDSSAPDADVCAKIIDVEPGGFACNVTEGAQRARYRAGGTTDWLPPGTSQELRVSLHDTAHTFRPGHRIRVMISGANFPRCSRNLHTKTVPELGTLDEAVTADLTVHHSQQFPSRIVLRTALDTP